MAFFRRKEPLRRWLRNLPTIPVQRGKVDTYTYTYSYGYSTITTNVPIDRGLFPSLEAFEKLSFINLNEYITITPHREFYLDLKEFVKGTKPIFYYLTERPYWIDINDSVISGRPPATIDDQTEVKVGVLIENPAGKATFDLKVRVLTILTFVEGNTYRLPLSDFFPGDAFHNLPADRIQVSFQQLREGGNPAVETNWVHVYNIRLDTELTANYVSATDDIYVHVPVLPGDVTGGQLRIVITILD